VVEQRRSSAYLGPDKGRWTAAQWSDVVEAAAGGLLDESHWVDLKEKLPPGRTHNTDLAVDLASLAVHGGMIVIGVEDRDSRAGKVVGVELGKLADRVDQIAREKIHPPLAVRSHEVYDPDRPGHGCLLVHVPPSAQAPHQVDYVYYGRGDRANHKLSDDDVRRIIYERLQRRTDVLAELHKFVVEDPIPVLERVGGHFYLLAQPEVSNDEALVDFLSGDAETILHNMLIDTMRERNSGSFEPDVNRLVGVQRRPEGLALHNYWNSGRTSNPRMFELIIREDCGIRLVHAGGTDKFRRKVYPEVDPIKIVILDLVVGLTYSAVALAGKLADQYGTYQGQWRLGVYLKELKEAVGYIPNMQSGFDDDFNHFAGDNYERTATASTEELVNSPQNVTERLLAPLLRGLNIGSNHYFRKR
jgi:hypothetical protein